MTALLPRWPSDWWVSAPPGRAGVVRVVAVDPLSRRLEEYLPVYRGIEWESLVPFEPRPWLGAHECEALVRVGWLHPTFDGGFPMTIDVRPTDPQEGWDWYEGGGLPGPQLFCARFGRRGKHAERLRWTPRLPPSLAPVADRVTELLGRGELALGARYTVPPP